MWKSSSWRIFSGPSTIISAGFFQNVGSTRRQGIEAGIGYRDDKWQASVNYSFIGATFQSAFTLSSPNNPFADAAGNIQVTPGDQLSGVPQNRLKKLAAAVVDVETTGTNPDRDKIIELGICLFEYDRQSGQIYKVLGSWEWFDDPGFPIPPEITKITGITDAMVAGHRIDDRAVNDLLSRVVLVIAHNASSCFRNRPVHLPS